VSKSGGRIDPAGNQINEMLQAGCSVQVIASRLGLSIAEVEFAVALMERRGEEDADSLL